jgi:glycosyltransferase involved in cell wall biosynthesis
MRIAIHDYAGHPFQFDLSRALARRGHEVGHFYFSGDKGPKGAAQLPGDPTGFSVHPVGIGRDYDKRKFVRRALDDMAYGRAVAKAVCAFRPDVVLSANTPLESQRFLLAAAHRADAAFVFWMQDFYSLAVKRILRDRWAGLGRLIARYYLALEQRLLRAGDAIVYISPDFPALTKTFKLKRAPTYVVPNWASIDNIPVRDKDNAWSRANGLAEPFVFLYSGTLALKHNPDLLWSLARRFADRGDVVVAVAACGVGRDALEKKLAQEPLPNLRLFDLQPLQALPDMLGAADVLVALLEGDAGEFSVPSKIPSYYCAGRPVLLSAAMNNLAARTTLLNGCGQVSPPDDVNAFLTAAQRLVDDAPLRKAAGANARAYAEAHYRIESITDRFEGILMDAIVARAHKTSPSDRLRVIGPESLNA